MQRIKRILAENIKKRAKAVKTRVMVPPINASLQVKSNSQSMFLGTEKGPITLNLLENGSDGLMDSTTKLSLCMPGG
jgi:hypothetical protein